ncbi:hypothetical protein AK830_g6269 [Neonectria ditissima]|uniref:NmrA-like domain-containing protein n=1 Tax=Neonectria ditissima TaxID=78410 RepID=A0A0P7AR18_9HYPO|nr:hypothetical protein AK830_g6269 [Neonectria ditissima]
MATPTAFVCSATGTQGGALARQLRTLAFDVHTTTRNPDSPAAKALSAIGVKVVHGDWDNDAALRSASSGSQYLFLNLFPAFTDSSLELERAKRILSIAKEAGIKHVIYSSDFAVERNKASNEQTFIDRARKSKRNIEKETAEAGFDTWTVLRPGFFMANFILPKVQRYSTAADGVITFGYPATTRLPLIDHEDTAKFAVAVFQNPSKFNGHTIRLAGELLTAGEVIAALGRATGRNIRGTYLTVAEAEQKAKTEFMTEAELVVPQMAGVFNPDELKSWGVPFGSFEDFLKREKEVVEATYQNVRD